MPFFLKGMLKRQPLEPLNVTVYGKSTFPDMSKNLEMLYSGLPMLNLNMTTCTLRRGYHVVLFRQREKTQKPEGPPKPGSHQKAQKARNSCPLDLPQTCGPANLLTLGQ